MACALPAEQGMPLSRWSASELAREAVARGVAEQISGVTVWRWLSEDAIKPWQHRSWIFPRDPHFAERAGPILDLYAGYWQGERLHPGDYVICADESPQSKRAGAKPRRCPPAAAKARKSSALTEPHQQARSPHATSNRSRPRRLLSSVTWNVQAPAWCTP